MSKRLEFQIQLVSDAEPASGFGTEQINALVPRNREAKPIIPASHLKGLMKQALLDCVPHCASDNLGEIVDRAFGVEDAADAQGGALFSVSDACCDADGCTSTVTRTALSVNGTAKEGALRTTERIHAGSVLTGTINYALSPTPVLDTMVRCALLAVMEVGGSRNRGCGACAITIKSEERGPGDLLRELCTLAVDDCALTLAPQAATRVTLSGKNTLLKLTFEASAPVCLPGQPVIAGVNTIVSGFTIPASAVQGMVLHRINAINPDLASICFDSAAFRAWPLLPLIPKSTTIPVRVSTTHRISKLPENDAHTFCDEKIEPYDWPNAPHNAPLKGLDGVQSFVDGKLNVWRSSDMPRIITAHGVVNGAGGEHNLYTVESLAVTTFCGVISLPVEAAKVLVDSLQSDGHVTLGKSRSVRGAGTLKAEQFDNPAWEFPRSKDGTQVYAFVVQSPLCVDTPVKGKTVAEIMRELIAGAGWGEVDQCAGSLGVLFGWNRHQKGLQQALTVIEPGSVFTLKCKPDNLKELMIQGVGGGRERGCGAVLPHPGISQERYTLPCVPRTIKSVTDAGIRGWKLFEKSKETNLSPSQIGALLAQASISPASAWQYLLRQEKERPAAIWNRWEHLKYALATEFDSQDQADCVKCLKTWHDLAVAAEVPRRKS